MSDLRAQLGRMLVFTRVVDRGSFAAAGREIGLSRSLVSTAVAELEGDLGVRLLERTTRKLSLTQAGRRFAARAAQAIAEAEAALGETADTAEAPAGTLRVTSTSALVDTLVAPVLARLAAVEGMSCELTEDDRRRDLVAEGFDVGVRIGIPKESGFSARFLGEVRDLLVVSPALVRGVDVNDLAAVRALPWIAHEALPRMVSIEDNKGRRQSLSIEPRVVTSTGTSQRALLVAGAGASVAIAPLVVGDLAAGRLVELLPSYRARAAKIFALVPSTRNLPARTRRFLDAIADRARALDAGSLAQKRR